MLSLDVITNSNHKISVQNFVQKILFLRKLVSTFCFSHNSNSFVKNSESSPIRYLVHNHVQISRLIGYIIINQRVVIFLVQRRIVQIWQKVFYQVVYKELILECIKIRIRKISSGYKDRTRIKSLTFAFAFF